MTEINGAAPNEKLRLAVTAKTAELNRTRKVSFWGNCRWWLISAAGIGVIVLASIIIINSQTQYTTAPEAKKVMAAQEGLKFGILIPAYLPQGFDRANVELTVTPSGPNGAPIADLTYRNAREKAAIILRQWMPGNPELEILNDSRPIETKWGQGWLTTQSAITVIRVNIGQLHVELAASPNTSVPAEQLLQITNTLGLATDEQIYTFKTEPVTIKALTPSPPFIVPVNADGIQEFNLTLTPGGYSPVRFTLKKGAPARITFRALGFASAQVVTIPLGDGNSRALTGATGRPAESLEFTPQTAGDFSFTCEHGTYLGIMTVTE